MLAAAMLAACSTSPPPRSPDAVLISLVEEYFERQLELSPMNATSIGDSRYDDRLDDSTSPGFREKVFGIERAFLDRARRIDVAKLSPAARITYDIFVSEREQALEGQKFHEELHAVQPDERPAHGPGGVWLGHRPAAVRHRARTTTASSSACASSRAGPTAPLRMMRTGMSHGITLPRVAMAKVAPQLREIGAAALEDNIFWAPITAMPKEISAKDRQRLSEAYAAALTREVLPAYTRLADFIERDYLPAARTTVGWSDLPDGQAWYRWRIRQATTMDMPAEEIHQLGLAEVARIRGEMLGVKEQVGFKGDLDAFFKYLEEDPKFYFNSEDELLGAYRDVKRRIDALLPKLFADFPKADYEIRAGRAVPRGLRRGRFVPVAVGRRQAPGHLLHQHAQPQSAAALRARNAVAARGIARTSLPDLDPAGAHRPAALPPLQRLRVVLGRLGAVRGIHRQGARRVHRSVPVVREAVRRDAAGHAPGGGHRAARQGLDREQAIKYMLDNSSMAESDVTAKWSATSSGPARRSATSSASCTSAHCAPRREAQLGEAFDVREFHSQVLRDGAVPMDVLTAKIDRWIEAKRPARAV